MPREGMDLLPTMGKIVGIVGESKVDPALGLTIVAPTRVDELQMVGGRFEPVPGSSSGAPAITPAPAPATQEPGPAAKKPADAGKKDQPLVTPGTGDPGEINK